MAIAKPQDMSEVEFCKRVDRIANWFRQLNPYNFPGSILKIEDVNYSLQNPKIRHPLVGGIVGRSDPSAPQAYNNL
jgi:hypothetical protein